MDLELKDRIALVTGASRGIGKAIAAALAAEGCHLAICARSADALEAAAAEFEALGSGRVFARSVDVTDAEAATRFVDDAARELGGLDIVVNNVGGSRHKPFEETTDDDWRYVLELNLLSGVRIARQAIPHLDARGGGSIIFIASVWGRETGGAGRASYTAAKAAVIAAADVLALELAPRGIRVNSVAPGSILFPGGGWDRRMKEDPEAIKRFVEENLPLGRFGRPEEVASLVAFLASPKASLVIGACVAVDGGQGRSLI